MTCMAAAKAKVYLSNKIALQLDSQPMLETGGPRSDRVRNTLIRAAERIVAGE
jgi:hypothetical protein